MPRYRERQLLEKSIEPINDRHEGPVLPFTDLRWTSPQRRRESCSQEPCTACCSDVHVMGQDDRIMYPQELCAEFLQRRVHSEWRWQRDPAGSGKCDQREF